MQPKTPRPVRPSEAKKAALVAAKLTREETRFTMEISGPTKRALKAKAASLGRSVKAYLLAFAAADGVAIDASDVDGQDSQD